MVVRHRLELRIERDKIDTSSFGEPTPAESRLVIDVSADDLAAAWVELIDRLPTDVWRALAEAVARSGSGVHGGSG